MICQGCRSPHDGPDQCVARLTCTCQHREVKLGPVHVDEIAVQPGSLDGLLKVIIDDFAAPVTCTVCAQEIEWISCPTGGWWAHVKHSEDGHEAISPVSPRLPDGMVEYLHDPGVSRT